MVDHPQNPLARLLAFVDELDRRQMFRRLACVRDAIMVEVHVPGARGKVEFFADGPLEVEVFRSGGDVLSGTDADAALERLFREDDEAEADPEERRTRPPQRLSE